jgi:hypothetical protein
LERELFLMGPNGLAGRAVAPKMRTNSLSYPTLIDRFGTIMIQRERSVGT